MGKLAMIGKLITDPATRFYFLSGHGWYHNLSDEEWIRRYWRYYMKTDLHLDPPVTFCEKMQWLKLHDHNPYYTLLADKYEVKRIVADKIGAEHIVPLLGVWDSFDAIDFDALPERFILKTTHDSGGFLVCKDKASFDKEAARKKFAKALKRNFYWTGREHQYKDIPPRIIAETYIDSLGKKESIEYKLTCMNGRVVFTTVCTGIAHAAYEARTNDSFDREGRHMPWYAFYKNAPVTPVLPPETDEMISYAETLAEGIPYVRVDFYLVEGTVYFGEMTFYTWDGFLFFTPPEWDRKLGEMLEISVKEGI